MSLSKQKRYIDDDDLPEDVIVNILSRLPVLVLVGFTTVSKRWRSIIVSDPQFAKSQLLSHKRALHQRVLLCFYQKNVKPNSIFQTLFGGCLVSQLTVPSDVNFQRVISSCNGLVLLGERCPSLFKNFCIWNPSTGFSRRIPCPDFEMLRVKTDEETSINHLHYGFGQVSDTSDYKVVFIEPAPGEDFVNVHVFSLKFNCWKFIKAPSFPCTRCTAQDGTLSNGAIQWVNYSEIDGIRHPTLVAFDLAEEEFRQVPLPGFTQIEDGMPNDLLKRITRSHELRLPILFGGGLCVWSEHIFKQIEIWVMREYGVPDSWVKLVEFNRHELPRCSALEGGLWDPICVSEAGTIFIKNVSKRELVWIECLKKQYPYISARYSTDENSDMIFNAIVYDETLVSVPE